MNVSFAEVGKAGPTTVQGDRPWPRGRWEGGWGGVWIDGWIDG